MTLEKANKILNDEALLQKKARQFNIDPEKYRQELQLWIYIEEAKQQSSQEEVRDLTVQLINLQRTIDEQRR